GGEGEPARRRAGGGRQPPGAAARRARREHRDQLAPSRRAARPEARAFAHLLGRLPRAGGGRRTAPEPPEGQRNDGRPGGAAAPDLAVRAAGASRAQSRRTEDHRMRREPIYPKPLAAALMLLLAGCTGASSPATPAAAGIVGPVWVAEDIAGAAAGGAAP